VLTLPDELVRDIPDLGDDVRREVADVCRAIPQPRRGSVDDVLIGTESCPVRPLLVVRHTASPVDGDARPEETGPMSRMRRYGLGGNACARASVSRSLSARSRQ
jgi:hypothetical protein